MKKILIFDGYPSIYQLLAKELAAEGYVTMSVSKAEFVKETVERFDPDLIILDLFFRGETPPPGHMLPDRSRDRGAHGLR
jgi:DNA-binding response OmpR family regulator